MHRCVQYLAEDLILAWEFQPIEWATLLAHWTSTPTWMHPASFSSMWAGQTEMLSIFLAGFVGLRSFCVTRLCWLQITYNRILNLQFSWTYWRTWFDSPCHKKLVATARLCLPYFLSAKALFITFAHVIATQMLLRRWLVKQLWPSSDVRVPTVSMVSCFHFQHISTLASDQMPFRVLFGIKGLCPLRLLPYGSI